MKTQYKDRAGQYYACMRQLVYIPGTYTKVFEYKIFPCDNFNTQTKEEQENTIRILNLDAHTAEAKENGLKQIIISQKAFNHFIHIRAKLKLSSDTRFDLLQNKKETR